MMSRALLEEAEKTKETLNKRIIDMTVGEFLEVLINASKSSLFESDTKQKEPQFVYGVAGFAQLLNCSIPTANRKIKSGRFDKATHRDGRKLVFNIRKVLEIMKVG